jgi:CopG family transcriptional regulator/antitoxin EndoAI
MATTSRTSVSRTSKTYTISLPPDLASKAEYLAKRDSRTMSELFREAFRNYYARQTQELFDEAAAYAASRNPHGYTEADVPRLIKEVRASKPARPSKAAVGKAS